MTGVAPEISVVMSVYNGAETLRESMDSVLAQEGVAFEFIVVNDGSTDNSGAILDDYEARAPYVRVLHQENQGLTRALIVGCAAARGEFIARQDAGGDISLPGRLRSQAALLRQHDTCSFVSCWTDVVGPRGEFLWIAKGTGQATEPLCVLSSEAQWGVSDGPSHHTSVMFRRSAYELVGGYRYEFYFGQDWDLWYRLAEVGSFCMIQKSLCQARIMPGSISGSSKAMQEQFARLSFWAMRSRAIGKSDAETLEKANELLRSRNKRKLINTQRACGLYFIGQSLIKNGDNRGVAYLRQSVREQPLFFRGWLALLRAIVLHYKSHPARHEP